MPKQTFFNLPDDKRALILELAIEEFAGQNYNNASISRIVERAGIAKGSFYQYFTDKQDLYLYLIDVAIAEKKRALLATPPPGPDMDVFAYLRWLITAGLRFEFTNPRQAQIAYRALFGDAPLPEETRAVIEQGTQPYFRQLVEQGVAQGVIDPAWDADVAAFVFNAIFTNLGEYLLRRLAIAPERLLADGGQALEAPAARAITEEAIRILERGLGRTAVAD